MTSVLVDLFVLCRVRYRERFRKFQEWYRTFRRINLGTDRTDGGTGGKSGVRQWFEVVQPELQQTLFDWRKDGVPEKRTTRTVKLQEWGRCTRNNRRRVRLYSGGVSVLSL